MAFALFIDGVDVSAYVLSYEVEDSLEDVVDTAKVVVYYQVKTLISSFYGKSILITEGVDAADERYIFRGTIRGFNDKTLSIDLECRNKLQQLADREVTTSFDRDVDEEQGVVSEIALNLVTSEDFGGLNGDATTFQDSGTDITVKQFICNADTVLERVGVLADLLGYQLYYRALDDKVYFEEIGRTTNSGVLRFNTVGTSNLLDVPKYDIDSENIVTRVNVNGAKQLQTFTETFSGNGSSTSVTLTYTPSQDTLVTVDGVDLVRYQLDGVSSTGDYYVDAVNNQIVFNSAPGVGTDNVVIEYTSLRPTQVQEVNDEAETLYLDGGYVEETFTYTDIQSVDDARSRALSILEKVSTPLRNIIVRVTKSFGAVYPGESIRLVDEVNGVDDSFVVRSVTRHFPNFYDEINLGDDRLFSKPTLVDTNERLLKLEKEILQNTGILIQTRRADKTVSPDLLQSELYAESSTGTLWGTGVWNGGSWNVNGLGERVIRRRVWAGDIFWHDGADSNLIDLSNTDATIDTTLQEIRADT